MSNILCPSCGLYNVTEINEKNKSQLTLGPEFEYENIVHHCNDCGEQGEFVETSDE